MRRRPRTNPFFTNVGRGFDRVLIDMNTQKDFLEESAPAAIYRRSSVLANIRRIFDWARDHETFVVSSVDLHRREGGPRGVLPAHCLVGTPGAEKMDFSLLSPRIFLDDADPLSLPVDLTASYRQIIFPKWHADLWSNPRADRFLSTLRARMVIVFGAGLEHSIRLLVLGLRARGYPVGVIADASGGWNPESSDLALRIMQAKGASLISTDRFLRRPTARRSRRRRGTTAARKKTTGHPLKSSRAERPQPEPLA